MLMTQCRVKGVKGQYRHNTDERAESQSSQLEHIAHEPAVWREVHSLLPH